MQCKRRSSRLRGVAASKRRTVKVIKYNKMGSEMSSMSSPIVADIRVEIDGNKLEVKEVTTTEKCDENCAECREAARKRAYRARRKAYKARRKERRLAEKSHLEKAELELELEANPQPGGSREGTNSRKVNASNKYTRKPQHSIPQPSIPAKQAKRGNRREGAKDESVEVVTIDSSTDTELEDESEIVKILQKFFGN